MSDDVTFNDRALDDAVFRNCVMSRSQFDNIGLADARFTDVNLKRARLHDVNLTDVSIKGAIMSRSQFDNIRLADARFTDVDLQRARLRNVNMTDVSIEDATIVGLNIMGHDVSALIQRHEASANGAAPEPTSNSMIALPQLYVADLDRAVQFYVQKLGFDLMFSYGEPAFYAQIGRGGWRLNLRRVEGPVFDPGFREREPDPLSTTLTIDDARPIFQEWQAAGVDFHQSLRTEPWGALTFIVRDPDANLIAVAGRLL